MGETCIGIVLTITENEQLLPLADGYLRKQREEIVRDAQGVLAHDAARVRTGRVEVTQQSGVEPAGVGASLLSLIALGFDVVGDHALDGRLGAAVGVGRADRAVLRDRDHVGEAGGIAIDGCRGGKDDVGDVVLLHGLEECDAAADIDAVVLQGNLAGFAYSLGRLSLTIRGHKRQAVYLQSSEVDDIVNVGVLAKDLVQSGLIADINVVELRSLAADELNAVDDFL